MFKQNILRLLILAGIITVQLLHAATLYVGPEEVHSTIQSAIDAAGNGDIVVVLDGSYTGAGNRDINFHGKAVHLKSENGPSHCIIDAGGTSTSFHRAFIFNNNEQEDSVVEGFTITGGFHTEGGAILCAGASPIISGNIFTGNDAVRGGALHMENSESVIKNNTFAFNHAQTDAGSSSSKAYNLKVLSEHVDDVSSIEAILDSFIEPEMTDEEKAIALWRAVVSFQHQNPPPHEYLIDHEHHVHNVVKLFNVYGYAQCGCAGAHLISLARAAGFEARGRSIHGHGVMEIYFDSGWHKFDASRIVYYRREDGQIASVDDIKAEVAQWYDENPEYYGNTDLLYTLGKHDAIAMISRSEFHDEETGRLPSGISGVFSTMYAYDGSFDVEREYGHSEGHRCLITLRPDEKLVRNWHTDGRVISGSSAPSILDIPVGTEELAYAREYGDLTNLRIGSGRLTYSPNLTNGTWREGVEHHSNITCVAQDGQTPSLRQEIPDEPGTMVVRMRTPYVILAGRVSGELVNGRLHIEISTNNGFDYTHVDTVEEHGVFEVELPEEKLRPKYEFRVKLTLQDGAGLNSIEFAADVQVSQRALPTLIQGTNRIEVTSGTPTSTITVEPNTVVGSTRNEVYTNFYPETFGLDNRNIGQSALWIAPNYHIPEPENYGYVMFPITTPKPITAVRGGGFFRARRDLAGIKVEASFDAGDSWHEVVHAPGPYVNYTTFGELHDVPPNSTEVLVRYFLYGWPATGIHALRFDVDYEDGPDRLHPFTIVYRWNEDGVEKEHEQLLTQTPFSYEIEVEGEPVMESISLRATSGEGIGRGGAISAHGGSIQIIDSIFYANTAVMGPEVYLSCQAVADISYSRIETCAVTAEAGSLVEWGEGILAADPLFADAENGDFHLKSLTGRWHTQTQRWLNQTANA